MPFIYYCSDYFLQNVQTCCCYCYCCCVVVVVMVRNTQTLWITIYYRSTCYIFYSLARKDVVKFTKNRPQLNTPEHEPRVLFLGCVCMCFLVVLSSERRKILTMNEHSRHRDTVIPSIDMRMRALVWLFRHIGYNVFTSNCHSLQYLIPLISAINVKKLDSFIWPF